MLTKIEELALRNQVEVMRGLVNHQYERASKYWSTIVFIVSKGLWQEFVERLERKE
jgi:hypothetical protein